VRNLIKYIREEFYAELNLVQDFDMRTGDENRQLLKLAFERALANGTIRASEEQETQG
jgi:hypothetical protein